jgi:hypothetical protein
VNDRFGVTIRLEDVSSGLQIPTKFCKVVDFAVKSYPNGSVLVTHWLTSRRPQVNDRKPPMA